MMKPLQSTASLALGFRENFIDHFSMMEEISQQKRNHEDYDRNITFQESSLHCTDFFLNTLVKADIL